jgi:hypothetical protein
VDTVQRVEQRVRRIACVRLLALEDEQVVSRGVERGGAIDLIVERRGLDLLEAGGVRPKRGGVLAQ